MEGPRLNSTKEQKVSKTPLFMKDNRLSCKIVAEQPRLNVTLNLPESMFQGSMIFFKMILIYYMVQFSNMLSIFLQVKYNQFH